MARNIFLILSVLVLTSCSDIFSARDPEDPDSETDPYISESAAGLVSNLKVSLLSLDVNAYESLFATETATGYAYSFVSLASDISGPDIFIDWNIDNERAFLKGIKTEGREFYDIDIKTGPVDESADSLDLDIEYSVNITDGTDSTLVRGNFILDIIKTDGHFWYIRTWTDVSLDQFTSFSKLKEDYAF